MKFGSTQPTSCNGGIRGAHLEWWRKYSGDESGLYMVGLMDVMHEVWRGGHMARLDYAVVDDFGNLVPVRVQ